MVAFITSVFEAKLDELRRGRSLVLEKNHTLILGFGDRILEVIRELIEANESEPDAAIVIVEVGRKSSPLSVVNNLVIGPVELPRFLALPAHPPGLVSVESELLPVMVTE